MKNVRLSLIVVLLCMTMTSCDLYYYFFPKEYTDTELYEKCSSGVVLILNQYYYEVTLPNDEKVWFSDYDEVNDELKNLTADKEEILKNRVASFGTGFFISDRGEILTNSHVVNPTMEQKVVKRQMKDICSAFVALFEAYQENLSNQYDLLETEKRNCYYIDYYGNLSCDNVKLGQLEVEQRELASEYAELQDLVDGLKSADLSEISVKLISELGIAYNDTYVTSASDFVPCVLVEASDDEEADLAKIQTKTKITPPERHIFALPEDQEEDAKLLNMNDHLVMISYNAGIALSNTQIGIQSQLNSGNVSQNPDGVKVTYSIPALPGSSGSPVINKYGQLVAVNFAGINGTQNFNFGIVPQKVRAFLNR